MKSPKASIWTAAPEPGIPESPALLSDGESLWLAYYCVGNETIAVVRFNRVVDHHLSPINDEGLVKHRYAQAGLEFYSFNELDFSQETLRYSALNARHWVITFKDSTLDVVAGSGELVASNMVFDSPLSALLSVLASQRAQQTVPEDAFKATRL